MKILIIILTMLLFSTPAGAGVIPNGLTDDGSELWTLTDANAVLDDSGFEMLFEYGQFNTSDHTFGFYQYDTNANAILGSLDIFRASDSVGNDSNLVWDLSNDMASTKYGTINLASELTFGFYFVSDAMTYYSQSVLNGGVNYMDFFWQGDQFDTNNLYVKAWDNGTGRNYDEMIVGVSDVSQLGAGTNQIPEPASIALFGLAFIGMRVLKKNTKHNC